MIELKAPRFWYTPRPGIKAWALSPLALLWRLGARLRRATTSAHVARMPVICLGNVTIGGAGKTPTAITLAGHFGAHNPCFLTRGYRGQTRTATLAAMPDSAQHGDEAVLLARHAPVIVAQDRVAGLKLAEASGFDLVIVDDGYQNPRFAKTGVLVFDGGVGIGNGCCIPAGPLREPLDAALARARAVIIIGIDKTGLARQLGGRVPVFTAQVVPDVIAPGPYLAFAGIGRPDKFFDTLRDHGYALADTVSFPDHHPYTAGDMQRLERMAARHGARLLTTEKDHVRIPLEYRHAVATLPVQVQIDNIDQLIGLLKAA